MGYFVANNHAQLASHPPKNRIGGFSVFTLSCSLNFDLQTVQPHQQISTTPTISVSDTRYYGYRSYNPELGRWVSRDPMEEQGGVNLYGFCNNNSILFIDKDGRIWGLGNALIGGLVGAVASGAITIISNGIQGKKDILEGVASSVAGGFSGGFIAGAMLSGDPASISLGYVVFAGATGSIVSQIVTNSVSGNGKKTFTSAGAAELVISGVAGGLTGGYAGKAKLDTIARITLKKSLSSGVIRARVEKYLRIGKCVKDTDQAIFNAEREQLRELNQQMYKAVEQMTMAIESGSALSSEILIKISTEVMAEWD